MVSLAVIIFRFISSLFAVFCMLILPGIDEIVMNVSLSLRNNTIRIYTGPNSQKTCFILRSHRSEIKSKGTVSRN